MPSSEGGQVGAALGGVLAVHEGVIALAVGIVVGDGRFQIRVLEVDDRVALGVVGLPGEQVQQAVLGEVLLAVEVDGQAGVQVDVVPDALFQEFRDPLELGEQCPDRAVKLIRVPLASWVAFSFSSETEHALGELGGLDAAVAEGLHLEMGGQGVHGLGAHAVEAHRFLEGLAVVLAAGVDLGNHVHDLAQGNAAAVVAHVQDRRLPKWRYRSACRRP